MSKQQASASKRVDPSASPQGAPLARSGAERNAAATINYERGGGSPAREQGQQQRQVGQSPALAASGSLKAGALSSKKKEGHTTTSPGQQGLNEDVIDTGGATPAHEQEGVSKTDIGDDWNTVQAFVTEHFTSMAVEGFITGYELMDICELLGLAIDEDMVRQMVPSFDHIDLEMALDVISQLRTSGKLQNVGKGKELTAIETIVISPGEYIWRKIRCVADPPNTVYEMRAISCDLQPRQVLVGSTGLLMFVMGLCIIGVVAIVWLNSASTTERRIATEFGQAVGSFINGVEREMMTKNGEEQRDTAETLNTFLDVKVTKKFEYEHNRTLMRLERLRMATEILGGIEVLNKQVSHVKGTMTIANRVARLYDQRSIDPVTFMSSLIKNKLKLQLPSWHVVVIAHNRTKNDYVVVADSHPTICNSNGISTSSAASTVCHFDIPAITTALEDGNVGYWPRSTDLAGKPAVSLSVTIPLSFTWHANHTNLLIVAALRQSALMANMRTHFKAGFNFMLSSLIQVSAARRNIEFVLVTLAADATFDKPSVKYETPIKFQPDVCLSLGVCGVEQLRAVYTALRQRSPTVVYGKDRSGRLASVVAVPTRYDIAYVSTMHVAESIEDFIEESIVMFNYLNYVRIHVLGFTIEAAVVRRNDTTGQVFQSSDFAFVNDCLGKCERTPLALLNAERGFARRDKGYSVTPDYRPEPVMGGYSYTLSGLTDITVLLERDVTEIRQITLNNLIKMINDNNLEFIGTFEMQLVYQKGVRFFTYSYDPAEPCPRTETCAKIAGIGNVIRSDCLHCSRQEALTDNRIGYLTKLKFADDCTARGVNCSAQELEDDQGLAHIAINAQYDRSGVADTTDYRNVRVYGFYGTERNFSISYYLKQDYSEIFGPINFYILISLGSSILIVLTALVILTVLSRRLVLQIEAEWMQYKVQITKERAAFSDLVREVLPGHIAEKIMKGQLLNATSCNICIAFIDVSGSMNRAKTWAPATFCRYVTYTLHVIEALAIVNDIHRVRTIGDSSVLVSGLDESAVVNTSSGAGNVSAHAHYIVRMVRCCTMILKLSTPRHAHYPHRCDLMQSTYGRSSFEYPELDGAPDLCGFLAMPSCKIGIHAGVGSSVVVNAAQTPNYDVLGATPSLAMRLASTSKPGNCHVSDTVKEHIEKTIAVTSNDEWYTFTQGVKTVIRGRGTVQSFFVKEASVTVDGSLAKELGVRFAKRRFTFDHDKNSKTGSSKQGTIRGSFASSFKSTSVASSRSYMTKSSERSTGGKGID